MAHSSGLLTRVWATLVAWPCVGFAIFATISLNKLLMDTLSYFVWQASPIIFSLGRLPIRWYGVCIMLAFLLGRGLVGRIYQKTQRPLEDVDTITLYLLIAAMAGARLGQVFFYQPAYYLQHPLEALLPISFYPSLHITGYQGLSYHGAIIGAIIGLYLYANYRFRLHRSLWPIRVIKKQPKGQSFLWLSTPAAMGLLMCFLIRIGNFFNSELIGTPTNSPLGVIFAHQVTEQLQKCMPTLRQVQVQKCAASTQPLSEMGHHPITLAMELPGSGLLEQEVRDLLEHNLKHCLTADAVLGKHIYEEKSHALQYTLTKGRKNQYIAEVSTVGIARHPVQLYESLAYFLIFLLLWFGWNRSYRTLRDGVVFGSTLVLCYGARFGLEFFKSPFNVLLTEPFTLTMGHLLSLLTALGGMAILGYVYITQPPKHP